jgi:hypothetical protein
MKTINPIPKGGGIYAVYIRHNYGIDRLLVTIKKRSVALAGETGRMRAMRNGHTGVGVADVVPMRYVAGELVETRRKRLRVQKGKTVMSRRAKTHASSRVARRAPVEGPGRRGPAEPYQAEPIVGKGVE